MAEVLHHTWTTDERVSQESTRSAKNKAGRSSRERLMQSAIEHVIKNGMGDFSVRGVATAIGTSHRVLSYHFGSREEFLREIMNSLEKKHAEELVAIENRSDFDADDALLRTWDYFTQPSIFPYTRVAMELVVWGMRETPGGATQYSGLGKAWSEPLLEFSRRSGVPPEQAEMDAHIALAMLRGLLFEFAATGDRDGPRAVLAEFVHRRKRG